VETGRQGIRLVRFGQPSHRRRVVSRW
jgi:hypothetical protein